MSQVRVVPFDSPLVIIEPFVATAHPTFAAVLERLQSVAPFPTRSGYAVVTNHSESAIEAWFGGSDNCCDPSAPFVGSRLMVEAKTRGGDTLTIIFALTPERDLLEEALINGRGQGPMLAKRQ